MKDGTGNGGLQPELGINLSANPSIGSVIEARYSRRQALFGGGAFATAAALAPAFALTACDDGGSGESFSNPVASAGAPVATSSGKLVTLNGSATDGDGTVGTGRWVQTSGPAVAFLGTPAGNSVSFLAPSVASATPLGFRFSVTDDDGLDGAADTTVTVEPAKLDFAPVAKNLNDIVTVPAGYQVTVLYALGDPIDQATPAYANNGTDTGFGRRAGDHHDGLYFFGLSAAGVRDDAANNRGLLVTNHENITQRYLHPNGPTGTGAGQSRPESEVLKEIEAHGVSVVEVQLQNGAWRYVQNSALNRRVTPNTEMQFNGPVRGSALIRTAFSPDGTRGRGTINNCANGYAPWGSYLTCEENYAFYFRRPTSDTAGRTAKELASLARNGITGAGNYGWSTVTPAQAGNTTFRRWDARVTTGAPADGTGDFRNEPNQFGWVVEIDPYDPNSTPRKRTAMGRFAHEGAWPSNFTAGQKPAYYMGDDSRGEYIYKFVSATAWDPADVNRTDRLAVGDKYLDNGVLYVARFNPDGSGQWLPLVFGQGPLTAANTTYAFASQADVLVNARLAGDVLGATKMDRPEWGAVNPVNGEVYFTLTNTNAAARPITATDPANPRFYADPKLPQGDQVNQDPPAPPVVTTGNANGHIIRMREAGDTAEATSFRWDIFVFGAGRDLDRQNVNISGLDDTNDFSSPDGLWFGRGSNASGRVNPLLWIQTDDGAYTDVTNCMMLAAMPGVVGDGARRTITNTSGSTQRQQETIAGKELGMSLRRFCVGPKECEITGIDSTPDGRAIFINIQHPGEDTVQGFPNTFPSNWPASQTNPQAVSRPRSATVVITKTDGGVVGL